jgi:hypothetical protein
MNADFPVVDPHSNQQLTKRSSRNSFVLKMIHFDGGVGGVQHGISKEELELSCYPTDQPQHANH